MEEEGEGNQGSLTSLEEGRLRLKPVEGKVKDEVCDGEMLSGFEAITSSSTTRVGRAGEKRLGDSRIELWELFAAARATGGSNKMFFPRDC